MRLVNPSWIGHTDENRRFEIYSLDASSDGKRLVTGGLDSKVKVWSTAAIADPDDASKPRLLASMASHTGAVTTVAFSPDGRYIASGSDDRIVLVSELDTSRQPRRELGSQSTETEVWTPRKRLVGHDNDVQDLAWSPDGQLLVSVGLDSAIIVWSGTTFERLKRLDWHQSHVKGVAFDPANKFFVTCSDDRTARIVRYSRASPTELSFSVEAVATLPFTDSPLTTYFRRCSWSPDGESIACPNATNGPIPTVAILDRGQWSAPKERQISLVGHEGTTEVAEFSPRMYSSDGGSSDESASCVVATAGEDGAVAVWSTENPRPLVVIQNVATKMITDLAWAPSGLALYACSLDGSVVEIAFGAKDLGSVQSLEESQRRLEKYGNATDLMDIPQSVEQITVAKEAGETKLRQNKGANGKPADGRTSTASAASKSSPSAASTAAPASGDSADPASSGAPPADSNAKNTAAASAAGSARSTTRDKAAEDSASAGVDAATAANASPAAPGAGSGTPVNTLTPVPAPAQTQPAAASRDAGERASGAPINTLSVRQKTSVTKDGRKRVTPMLLNSSGPEQAAAASVVMAPAMPTRAGATTSMHFDRPSQALPPGGISTLVIGNKRKSEDDPQPAPKRHKDEPTYLRPVALNPSTTVSQVRLATPRVVSHVSSDEAATAVLEARNASRAGDPTRVSVVAHGHVVFVDFIAEYASLLAGESTRFWAVASDTGVVYTWTPQGSRALPPLVLGAPVSVFESRGPFLVAITATGLVYAWDMEQRRSLFPPQSVGPCLDLGSKLQENGLVKAPQVTQCFITDEGHVLVALSNANVFHFNAMLMTWERVSESFWAYGSQFWDSTGLRSSDGSGPISLAELRTNEEALLKAGARGRQLQRQAVNRMVQAGFQGFEQAVSLAHLGNRVAAARSVQSPELHRFTEAYVRRLSERGDRLRLGEVFRGVRNDPPLLAKLLNVAAQFKGVQTLVAEYENL